MNASRSRPHTGFEQRLLARLKAIDTPSNTGIVVGFSGGADSIALAAGLGRVAHLIGVSVTLVHVDHRLRLESSEDAVRAFQLGTDLGLTTRIVTAPASPTALYPQVGVEEAARRVRYVALAEIAHELGTNLIATAHHADDQAETVLLHMLRGAGLTGAAAMSEISTLMIPWWVPVRKAITYQLWRPLLDESRSVVHTYTEVTGLTPIEDPSNSSTQFTRNRIRHEVMPVLRSINPAVSAALGRHARIVSDEDRYIDGVVQSQLDAIASSDGSLPIGKLQSLDLALQRRLIRRWLSDQGFGGDLSFERVESIHVAIHARRGSTTIEIGDGWSVTVQHGMLTTNNGSDARTDIPSELPFTTQQEDR